MKHMMAIAAILSLFSLTACDNGVKFAEFNQVSKSASDNPIIEVPDIVDPVPTVTPSPSVSPVPSSSPSVEPLPTVVPSPTPVEPVYTRKSGACAADSSTAVTSCMKCQIPAVPVQEPPMSLKARQLMAIMTAICPIHNTKYGYKAVTQADHLAKLNRCSSAIYPDSKADKGQADIVNRLMNGDVALQTTMFTGLYYKPPMSDFFETYFGLDSGEALRVFCQQSAANVGGTLVPSMTAPNPYGPKWDVGLDMPKQYVIANTYKNGLRTCIQQSRTNPWQPSGGSAVAKSCNFETLSGDVGDVIYNQASSWLAAGQAVGADIKNRGLCISVKSVDDLKGYSGEILVGTYKCQ